MKFENSIVINKPIEEVFTYLAQLEHLPEWNYAIKRTVNTAPGNIGVGAKYLQERTLPRPTTEELVVAAYEPSRLLEVSGTFGPFKGMSSYRLVSIDDQKTRLQNEIILDVRGAMRLLAPVGAMKIKAAVAQNLQVLKHILETR